MTLENCVKTTNQIDDNLYKAPILICYIHHIAIIQKKPIRAWRFITDYTIFCSKHNMYTIVQKFEVNKTFKCFCSLLLTKAAFN